MKKILLTLMVFGLVGCMSQQAVIATHQGMDNYELCFQYFSKLMGSARSQEFRYVHYKSILNEVANRELDCKMFPEFKNKKPFMEERVRLYEEQGSW